MPVMTDVYLAWSLAKSKEEFKSFFEDCRIKTWRATRPRTVVNGQSV
jgi:hypothetical protein